MANRLTLDPALGGGVPPRQYSTDRSGDTFAAAGEKYRSEATRPSPQSYTASAQPTPQPYYPYAGQGQQHGTPGSATSQQSPGFTAQASGIQQSIEDAAAAAAAAQDDAKRQRACDACRGLKVRCDQDPARPDIPCKRCAKAGRACIITQPSRKRQKKADSRVAELEKKLDALTAALEHRVSTGGIGSSSQAPHAAVAPVQQTLPEQSHASKKSDIMYEPPSSKRRRLDDATVEQSELTQKLIAEQPGHVTHESRTAFYDMNIDEFKTKISNIVSPLQGSELFKRYNETMSPYLPMVVFPRGINAKQVFEDKPILYLAVITAASGSLQNRELQDTLQRESMGAIADSVVRNGAKSLELIQAMLIMAAWYKPPERAEQTNFYQIIHIGAVMALDIGLGRRFYPRKSKTPLTQAFGKPEIGFSTKHSHQDSDALDARRAWLGCYYLCATSSMVLRRPNLVRWSEYMKECIEVLENSPDACLSDKLLCQHIKIQHICEDIGLQFLMDDSTAQLSINDPKVTYALVTFENQLKSWKQQVPDEVQCASLTFFEHVTSLYLHEIALHFNHNIDDFRLPFTEESLKNIDSSSDALTQNQIAAIEACLKAAHGVLDTMINFTPDEVLALPLLLYFVRCIYALVILLKMHVAISTPGAELGKLLQNADLKIEYYLDALVDHFARIWALPYPKPEKALRIMQMFREWFRKQKDGATTQTQGAGEGAAVQQGSAEKYGQTPLHMLSQVATGQQDSAQDSDNHADWTFSTPGTHFTQRKWGYQHPQQSTSGVTTDSNAAYNSNMLGIMDNQNQMQAFNWGSGFEQAMDMAMGPMGELSGNGLDNWLLGTNNTPFSFNDGGEGVGQW